MDLLPLADDLLHLGIRVKRLPQSLPLARKDPLTILIEKVRPREVEVIDRPVYLHQPSHIRLYGGGIPYHIAPEVEELSLQPRRVADRLAVVGDKIDRRHHEGKATTGGVAVVPHRLRETGTKVLRDRAKEL